MSESIPKKVTGFSAMAILWIAVIAVAGVATWGWVKVYLMKAKSATPAG